MSYRFNPEETTAEAFHRTSRELLSDAERTLLADATDNQTKAVHSARKAIKKERSLLRLTRDATAAKRRRRENAALRDAARRLSGSRDAAVMIATLDQLAERYAGQVPHTVFDTLRVRLRADQPVFSDLSPVGPEGTAAAELARVRDRIDGWTVRGDSFTALAGGLDRTYRRGRQARRTALRHPTDDNLHTWRKRTKDLWYELRLLGPVGGEMVSGHAKEAHRLADLLGDDHDLAVLRSALHRHSHDLPTDVGAVLGLLDHRRRELQADARRVGARVYAESPKAYLGRMRRLWKAGREAARAVDAARPAELAETTRAPVAA